MAQSDPALKPDDYELMQRIADGDTGALTILFDRYSRLVQAVGMRMLGDRAEAEDVLVELFFELWTRADRYDPARGAPMTYLMTVARSRCIDRRRSAPRRNRAMEEAPDGAGETTPSPKAADPAENLILSERARVVRRAVDRLDPLQRQAVELSFYSGLSHGQIAEKLGKPLGTVKTWIRQGLIQLRDSLRTQEGQ